MTKTFSIIVPCFNQAHLLSETLNSVLNQTFTDWECIIVNDGSPDNTNAIAKKFIDVDNRFFLLEQNNQGLAASRNNGIKNTSGKYIICLDSDDLISKDYLMKIYNEFEKTPTAKVVYTMADFFGYKRGKWPLPEYTYDTLLFRNCFYCSAAYKREDYLKTNGYNNLMKQGFEDWDFWLSLIDRNDIVIRIDEILFHYRTKKISMIVEANEKREMLQQTIYDNHKELYNAYCRNIISYRNQNEDQLKTLNFFLIKLLRFIKKPFNSVKRLISKVLYIIKHGKNPIL